jgi:hypothetical protein
LLLARSVAACVPVLGLLVAVGAGNASAAARVPAGARAAAPLAALEHLMIGQHATDHAVGGHVIVGGSNEAKKATSGNWSGYADTGIVRKFTSVTASWTEPAIACPAHTSSMVAFWVGIDGYVKKSRTVEQDGTLAWCDNGSPYYYTWWEMDPTVGLKAVGFGVKPGDHITASVTRTSVVKGVAHYRLKVTDSTPKDTGNSFTKYQPCAVSYCIDSSAEWVAEAPTESSGQQEPLADFGTWSVTGGAVRTTESSGTIWDFPDYVITMSLDSRILAQPGVLSHGGGTFAVTWRAATG